MKNFVRRFLTTATCGLALSITPVGNAADLTIDGYGSYALSKRVDYFIKGKNQGGRYKNLGSDYYHRASYQMDFITNRSSNSSGSLSYEFWGMPYYGASQGVILMTSGLAPLRGGYSYNKLYVSGYALALDEWRYPDINLWEYTRKGWKFKDSLTFTKKTFL